MTEDRNGWTVATLGDLCAIHRGVSYKKLDARSEAAEGFLPILRATNIREELTFTPLVYVPDKYVKEEQLLRPGDIVVATSSGSRSVVGKAAGLREPWAGAFGAFCMVLRPKPDVHPRYVSYFMKSRAYRERISEEASGVNINNLRRSHLEDMPIPLAPRHEQAAIVSELDKHFTRLDAAVAALRRVLASVERYRASLLQAAIDSARSGPTRPLGDLTDPTRPICYGILKPRVANGSVPYVEVRDLREALDPDELSRTSPELHHAFGRSAIRPGDLLMAVRGSWERVGVVPPSLSDGNMSRDVARIAVRPEFNANYVALCLRSPALQSYFRGVARGVAVRGVNIRDLRAAPILVPDRETQDTIVQTAEHDLSLLARVEQGTRRALLQAAAIRRGVLARAFRS